MNVTRTIRYEGNSALAAFLAYLLKEEGVDVEWTPPEPVTGRPGAGTEMEPVVVVLLGVRGTLEAIGLALERFEEFRAPLPHDARVVAEDPDGGGFPEP
jgi:hypothetical protein